uniref:Uncharacterized protein n=1 Tax=Arundo donax TaxID=35708 RepID=A0A0A9EKN9_ARUDO
MTRSLIGQGKHLQQPSPHNTIVPTTGTQTWGTPRSPQHKNSFTYFSHPNSHHDTSGNQPSHHDHHRAV